MTEAEYSESVAAWPGVHPDIIRHAIQLAGYRGGQTTPVSDYDIQRAKDLAEGEASEGAGLRAELRAAKAEIARLNALLAERAAA